MSKNPPIIKTTRLLLRFFEMSDAKRVQELAGNREIAKTTLLIPHPYEDGMAEEWISTHASSFENGEGVIFAIVEKEKDSVVGAIGLSGNSAHQRAELGYWIGVPYWGMGIVPRRPRLF